MHDIEKKVLHKGDGVGELALLYNAPRSASVKCKTDCEFWAINRDSFKNLIEEIVQKDYEDNRKFLEQAKFFSQMLDSQKNVIA